MSAARALLAAAVTLVALALQTSLLPHVAWHGVVPHLVLLVVVSTALTCRAEFSLLVAFAAGLLSDLAPPADHYAGRWALALVLVAWVTVLARRGTRPTVVQTLVSVAVASFVGTSVFALSGLVLNDPGVGVGEMLTVIGVGVGWDLLLAPVVVPALMLAYRRLGAGAGERERA